MQSIRQLFINRSLRDLRPSTKLLCDHNCQQRAHLSSLATKDDQTVIEEHKKMLLRKGSITGNVLPMIGLEVHAQLDLSSKLFSQGSNKSDTRSNSQLDYLDIALPGTLPKFNENALKMAILSSLELNCKVQELIHFDRKNYFYTDMPAGYQITQYNKPLAKDGFIEFIVTSYNKLATAHSQPYDIAKYLYSDEKKASLRPYVRRSHIKQIQIEQDSAKSLHQTESGDGRTEFSLVDYNRSGAALIEIVFEPDLTNHHEASSLIKELIRILRTLGTCNCELQEGSLRVDANVSIQKIDGQTIVNSHRVELKNLNSIKSLNFGIAYEIHRQANLIKSGKKVIQESRSFDTKSGRSFVLREKETTVDYRYVPDPNLPPLNISQDLVNDIKYQLPEINSNDKRKNLTDNFNLDLALVVDVLDIPGLYDYLIAVMKDKSNYDANIVADFLVYTALNLKNMSGVQMDLSLEPGSMFIERLKPEKMQVIIDMLFKDHISFMNAYEIIKHIVINNAIDDPRVIVDEFGWHLINDDETIREVCESMVIGMKNVSKKYRKTGEKRFMKMMLSKLSELHDNRISIRKAIELLDKKLRPCEDKGEESKQVNDPKPES